MSGEPLAESLQALTRFLVGDTTVAHPTTGRRPGRRGRSPCGAFGISMLRDVARELVERYRR